MPAPPGVEPSAGAPASGEPKPVSPVLRHLGSFAARALLCLAPVYLAGYVGLSSSWVLIGLLLWMWWRRNRREKRSRLLAAFGLVEDEKQAISQGIALQQLPAWVSGRAGEGAPWGRLWGTVLEQAWPYFGSIMEKTFKEVLEPKIRAKNVHLKTCTFTKIQFGDKCPKIKGVKAYTKEVDRRQVILDLQICYIGDCEIHMELSKFKAGMKGIQLYGTLRVILEPLLTDPPFIGAVTLFFIQKPHLEISWAGLTNLLDAPGISSFSDTLIQDLIAARLVLPNRITIPLKKNIDISRLKFPIPYGVIRVYLQEAENLVQMDNFLGKSDPYALLRVGQVQFRSKTVHRNLNPIWNEMFEFVVHEIPGQDLEVDLYDEDPDKDDFLGSLLINLADVMKDRVVDEWFPLSKIASGHVHLKVEWFSLVTNQEKLCEVSVSERSESAEVRYLPQLMCGCRSFSLTLQTCNFTKDPAWGQAFTFFVHSAPSQSLHLEVNKDRENALGTFVLSLGNLLKNPDMTLEQNFQLDHSGVDSSIKLKVVLRVSLRFCIFLPPPQSTYTGVNASKQGPIPATEQDEPKGKTHLPPPPPPPPPPSPPPPPKVEVPKAPQERSSDLEAVAGINEQAGTGVLRPKSLTPAQTIPGRRMLPALQRLQVAPSIASLGSISASNFDVTCKIHLTVRYASLRQSLIVLVNACRNLTPCSQQGAHPYVRIYLLPDKRWVMRRRTTVKKRTLNPHYDEKFEFFDTLEDIKKRALDIAVKNRRRFISHERKELGKVLIDLSKEDLVRGFSQWYVYIYSL
uniref:Extended synaptotagmin 3 n=1 Tax=Podarcis muralis TaxID=64176 RepID=A0A670ICU3_PODMU